MSLETNTVNNNKTDISEGSSDVPVISCKKLQYSKIKYCLGFAGLDKDNKCTKNLDRRRNKAGETG